MGHLPRILYSVLVACCLACAEEPSPSEEEATAFARRLEETLKAGDASFYAARFSMDAVLDVALADQDAKDEGVRAYRRGVKGSGDIPNRIAQLVASGSSYKFLRLRRSDGQLRALFREVDPETFCYDELVLVRAENGGVRVSDIYNSSFGEMLSQTIRRHYLLYAADRPDVVGRLLGRESDLLKHAKIMDAINVAFQAGKFQEALDLYRKLPEAFQADKGMLLIRVNSATNVSEKEFQGAIDAYEAAFPDDPSLLIASLAGQVQRKRYADAIGVLQRLDRHVGGDAYLVAQQGWIHHLDGKRDVARACLKRAMDMEPDLPSPYELLVNIAVEEKDYGEAVRLLALAEQACGGTMTIPGDDPLFAGFLRSDEYRKWVESRR